MSANKELVSSLYGAMANGDIATFFAALHPQVEWKVADGHPHAGTYVGIDALQDVQKNAYAEWEGFAATPFYLTGTEDDDTVISTGMYSGKHRETGKHMESRFAHVWRITSGKVVQFESISDTAQYRAATA